MIRSIARTLEQSVATHSPCTDQRMRQQRRRDLHRLPSHAQRTMALAIDIFAEKEPRLARSVLDNLAMRLAGINYVSNGVWSSVYQNGGVVLKVLRRTATMSPEERESYAQQRNDWGRKAYVGLGNIAVPQTYAQGVHPFGGYTVVLAHQRYVGGESIDLFTPGTTDLNESAVDSFCAEHPLGRQALRSIVDSTEIMHNSYGLVPDLNGNDNFRMSRHEGLLLIDPEPVSPEVDQGIYDLILAQAGVLAEYTATKQDRLHVL